MKKVETYADFCREMMNAECDIIVTKDRSPKFTRWYILDEKTVDIIAYLLIYRSHEGDKQP